MDIGYYIGFPSQKNANETHGHKKRGKKYVVVLPNNEYPLDDYFSPAGNSSLDIINFSKFIQQHLKGLMGYDNYLKSETYQKLHFGQESYSLG